jgi:anti-sigma factor RsiW
MNCTDLLSQLTDYFDDQLTAELREEVRNHTAECQHCRVVIDTTHQTIEVYRGNEIYEISPELRERLHSAIMSKCLNLKNK